MEPKWKSFFLRENEKLCSLCVFTRSLWLALSTSASASTHTKANAHMGVSADAWAASAATTPVVVGTPVDNDSATASDKAATDGPRLLDLVFSKPVFDCTLSLRLT